MARFFYTYLLASAVVLAGLAAAMPKPQTLHVANEGFAAPDDIIPGRYIVVYNNDADPEAVTAHQLAVKRKVKKRNMNKRSVDGRLLSWVVKTADIKGWRSMALDADYDLISEIMSYEYVAYVEADTKVKASSLVAQIDAPIGLRRLSVANALELKLDRSRDSITGRTPPYVFDDSGGEGINVYVLDTGVSITHSEFEGRASFGFNAITDELEEAHDGNGHGSHVAGTIAGRNFGVAKRANIVAVKVLGSDGSGSNSDVIQGLNYVSANATSGRAVLNLSLGGSRSDAVNAAIESLVSDENIVPVVAAGNEGQNARNFSPASAENAITVGAIDATNDRLAGFSNFGDVVDILAPGVRIVSVGTKSDTAIKRMSGTSMASPHIAGLAAYLMSKEGISDVNSVRNRIVSLARDTGAQADGVPRGTSLIASNGNY